VPSPGAQRAHGPRVAHRADHGGATWRLRERTRLHSRHIAGAWRYVLGGVLRNDSPKEALAVGWALLFASSAIFGLAHAPGWGLWKVVPAMVAGLGFGYLFLRHGIGAAILAHFVNDYAIPLSYEGVGGEALMILIDLLVLGLAVAGSGFLGL